MKRLVLLFIIANLYIALFSQSAAAPSSGEGSVNDPYQISTLGNLYWIAAGNDIVPDPDQQSRWSGHYIQTADIDASDTEDWFNGEGWTPIGYYSSSEDNISFSGSYDGQEYSIDGLFIDQPEIKLVGLFKFTEGALLENIGLTNVTITGGSVVGALVGLNSDNSVINNCYSSGSLTAELLTGFAGGLAGENSSSVIEKSYSTVDVNGSNNIGGLVGLDSFSSISYSYSTGMVTGQLGSWRVGGLIGEQTGSTMDHCYSTGDVSGYSGIGGLVGWRNYSSMTNSYSAGMISGYASATGGLVGIDVGSLISDSYSTGDVNGHYYTGGLVGFLTCQPNIRDTDSREFLKDKLPERYSGCPPKEYNHYTIDNSYSLGNVSGQFYIGGLIGFMTDKATLNNSYSTGMVTGEGHYIGGLVGTNQNLSTISNSFSTGDVNSYSTLGSWAGGLAGNNWNSRIVNCYSTGNVTGSECTGGLAGESIDSVIAYSYSIGSVTGSANYTGGLVGCGDGKDTHNYWNIDTSGQTESSMGEGRYTSDMTYPYSDNTYTNWDFEEFWCADEDYEVNDGYPYLRYIDYPVSLDDNHIAVEKTISLSNYPNPFNPQTTITYTLTQDVEQLELKIFNIRGQSVRTLIPGSFHSQGEHRIIWDGRNDLGQQVTSGIYFSRIVALENQKTKKLMLLK